jgi:hypothetical protein
MRDGAQPLSLEKKLYLQVRHNFLAIARFALYPYQSIFEVLGFVENI